MKANFNEVVSAVAGHLATAAKKTASYVSAQIDLAADRKKLELMQAQERTRQMEVQQRWTFYKDHYNVVGNAVAQCISNAHSKLGLNRPKILEDIYTKEPGKNVSIENGQVVFRYEADRRTSDLFDGGLRKVEYPKVPVEDIEKEFARQLPRYIMDKGYGYASLKVDDSEKGDSVVITLRGVN